MKRSLFRLLPLALAPVLLLLGGCEQPDDHPIEDHPEESTSTDEWQAEGEAQEEEVRDTVYIVTERRQAGGQLVEDPNEVSALDGRPRMKREPLEQMIIVKGDQTGQESAYLVPSGDFNVIREGQRLQESTLSRWESTSLDHIPPPQPAEENESDRSRAGGADGNVVY